MGDHEGPWIVGVVVDAVSGVVAIESLRILPTPVSAGVWNPDSRFITPMVESVDSFLILFDVARVLDASELAGLVRTRN